MTQPADSNFAGSIPEIYDRLLVPLVFEPYARDLAQRVAAAPVEQVLEIAAGTGVVTRALVAGLDPAVSILATDLSSAMLAQAASACPAINVSWQAADAHALPFADQSFDAVVCQFSVMFFADRVQAYQEVLRVLKPGGRFLFNVWAEIAQNEFTDVITTALAELYADDPPRFLARTPHGYADVALIQQDLRQAGFTAEVSYVTLTHRSHAESAHTPAVAFCQGTPLRNEIEQRSGADLDAATAAATAALQAKFGHGAVEGQIQAHVFTAERPAD